MDKNITKLPIFLSIREIITKAKEQAFRKTNSILLQIYWEIGRIIIENEQAGQIKATYGKNILKNLSKQLTVEFGKGFDERNLNNMRAFYHSFPIWNAVRTELSWTHYRIISRLNDSDLRMQYINHAIDGNWNTRTLQRNVESAYIGRLLEIPPKQDVVKTEYLIKDPYIFEFLGIPAHTKYSETQLESALINHLQSFLMELGKGFAFVARQQHIVTDTADFYIDLVFYNYHLKCFVLIDLKTISLNHEAIGQMDMYVRMYNDLKKGEDDNPTIGIILCTGKDETVVKYSVLAENQQLFASKYRVYLPSEQELEQLIAQDRQYFEQDKEL